MMMSINAFISDISKPDQRAFRMAMLHLFSSFARPLGPKIGAWLLESGDLGSICQVSKLEGVVTS